MSRHAQGLEPRRLLSAGGLDANFGNAGVATTSVGDGTFTVIDWGVTPSGKVVALGKLSPGQGGTRYSLTRFNADGTVDDSFAGEKTINGHPRGIDTVEHMAVLPDGRLIFAGRDTGSTGGLVLIRLSGNGKLDKSFGSEKGVLRLATSQSPTLETMGVQNDGRVLLVGESVAGATLGRIQVTRVSADGVVDKKFGHSGVFSSGLGLIKADTSTDDFSLTARAVTVTADGHILVGGDDRDRNLNSNTETSTPFVCRITSKGVIDRTLAGGTGLNGVVEPLVDLGTDARLTDIAVGGDDNSAVIGTVGPDGQHVYKLTDAGLLDPNYAGGGQIKLSAQKTGTVELARQSDGRILAASAGDTLSRFDSAGNADQTFDNPEDNTFAGDGMLTGNNAGADIRLGPDGSIVQLSGANAANTGNATDPNHGTLTVTRRWREEGPAGLLTVKNISKAPKGVFKFTVQWRDDDAVMVSSLSAYHIRVEGPADATGSRKALKARLLGITQPGDGAVRTAVYKISAPGGTWEKGDNGTWSVRLLGSRVRDTMFNSAQGRTLGTFVVKLK